MVAEGYEVVVGKQFPGWWHVYLKLHAIELRCLLLHMAHEFLVAFRHFGLDVEFPVYGVVAEIVVEVSMGAQQMLGCQPVVAYIACYGVALVFIEGTAVNDDTLFCLVAYYIAVFLKHVHGKAFNIEIVHDDGFVCR
jgi:hypothetical protein